MNYRHVFHAGNFADVFKHVLLSRALDYLKRKDAPLRYLDTHAGVGLYDVGSEAARRTGEWDGGVGRVLSTDMPAPVRELLSPWIEAAGLETDSARKTYPGSPVLAQRLLRRQDRLTLCELHEHDFRALTRSIGRDKRVKELCMDGYVALNAFVPPVERRGLVLIDPPFEEPDEFFRLTDALEGAWRKWPTGTYMVWYPCKNAAAVSGFRKAISRGPIRRALCVEAYVEAPADDRPLAGSGLVIVNPPHVLEAEINAVLPFLTHALARGAGATWRMDRLTGE